MELGVLSGETSLVLSALFRKVHLLDYWRGHFTSGRGRLKTFVEELEMLERAVVKEKRNRSAKMMKVKRALVSVFDKAGIVEFCEQRQRLAESRSAAVCKPVRHSSTASLICRQEVTKPWPYS